MKNRMHPAAAALAVCLAVSMGACTKQGKLAPVDLNVDLYLHPESGSSEDVLLQTAIRRNLAKAELYGVYVRVLDLHAVLTGTVDKAATKQRALEIARETEVKVDTSIKAAAVRDLVKLEGQ